MIERIVSGGQTGADRAAFDAAIEAGLPYGGWVPKGRLDERGAIPDRYANLREADSAEPAVRTRCNVRDADATLVVTHGPAQGGTHTTIEAAAELGRPLLHVDLAQCDLDEASRRVRGWLDREVVRTLNVAGPRASEDEAIYDAVASLLRAILADAPR